MADGHEITPAFIAEQFVRQYYSAMHKDPELVRKFYAADSTLAHLEGQSYSAPIVGAQAIHEKISSLGLRGGMAQILFIDSQQSSDMGILIMLTGTFVPAGESAGKTFNQSFYLAKIEPNNQFSYYVRNNIFRYTEPELIAPDAVSPLTKPLTALSMAAAVPSTPEPEPPAPPAPPPPAAAEAAEAEAAAVVEVAPSPAEAVEETAPPTADPTEEEGVAAAPAVPMSWAARAAAAASKASAVPPPKPAARPVPAAKADGEPSDGTDVSPAGAPPPAAAAPAVRPKEWGQGIFVRSVNSAIHEADKLTGFFSKFGEVKSLVCRDHGNAIVTFTVPAAAQAALAAYADETEAFSLEGHRVRIEELRTFGERFPGSSTARSGGRPAAARTSSEPRVEARAGGGKGRVRTGERTGEAGGGGRPPRARPEGEPRAAAAGK